jgi:hypothetical protein
MTERRTRSIHPRTRARSSPDRRPASPRPIVPIPNAWLPGCAGRYARSGWVDSSALACSGTLWLARHRIQVSIAHHGSAARPIRNSLGSFGRLPTMHERQNSQVDNVLRTHSGKPVRVARRRARLPEGIWQCMPDTKQPLTEGRMAEILRKMGVTRSAGNNISIKDKDGKGFKIEELGYALGPRCY